jgi:hypothetical protein
VHEGGYSLDAEGTFYDRWGNRIEAVPKLPRGDPQALLRRNDELEIDAATCEPGDADPLELADAVDALLAIERRTAAARAPCDGADL